MRLVAIPEMVDHVGHAEEGEDEGAGPAVALPDEVAAGIPSLAEPLLCDGSVELAVVPPGRGMRQSGWDQQSAQRILQKRRQLLAPFTRTQTRDERTVAFWNKDRRTGRS